MNKKSGLIYFIQMLISKYQHFYTYNAQEKCASLVFDEIKNEKSGLICFLGNKKKKKIRLPHLFLKKSGLRNTCLFFLAFKLGQTKIYVWVDCQGWGKEGGLNLGKFFNEIFF